MLKFLRTLQLYFSSLKPESFMSGEWVLPFNISFPEFPGIMNHLVLFSAVCRFPCQNGGVCQRPNACSCPDGWMGRLCEERESVLKSCFESLYLLGSCRLRRESSWELPSLFQGTDCLKSMQRTRAHRVTRLSIGCRRSIHSIYTWVCSCLILHLTSPLALSNWVFLGRGFVIMLQSSLPLPQVSAIQPQPLLQLEKLQHHRALYLSGNRWAHHGS